MTTAGEPLAAPQILPISDEKVLLPPEAAEHVLPGALPCGSARICLRPWLGAGSSIFGAASPGGAAESSESWSVTVAAPQAPAMA